MTTASPPPASSPTYVRRLGLFSATMLVVGGIIGSGIFLNPAIAAVAMTFAGYAAALVGAPPTVERPLALGAVALLTVVNVRGVAPGAVLQNVVTVLKLAALAALLTAVWLAPPPGPLTGAAALPSPATGTFGVLRAFGIALVPVLFAFGGWQQTNFVAEELEAPERTLPRALALGGDRLGFLDLVILVSPRVYQAMARDGLFFAAFAHLHPRYRTPAAAIVGQGVWACVLLLAGSYGQLLDYVTFADWIFFGLTAAALVVLRRRDLRAAAGAIDCGFRAPLYPWSVLAFVLAAAWVVAGAIASSPTNAGRGTALLLAGVPIFAWWQRRAEARRAR